MNGGSMDISQSTTLTHTNNEFVTYKVEDMDKIRSFLMKKNPNSTYSYQQPYWQIPNILNQEDEFDLLLLGFSLVPIDSCTIQGRWFTAMKRDSNGKFVDCYIIPNDPSRI